MSLLDEIRKIKNISTIALGKSSKNSAQLADSLNKLGDITQLNTTDKSSAINAIKEVKTQANSNATAITNNALAIATNTTQIASLASGSPSGVFTTLVALQGDATANTTSGKTKTYVVTADGKWYYWNGSVWTIGGTYQSTGIGDLSLTPTKMSMVKQSANLFNKYKATANTVVYGASGITGSQAGYYVSEFIEVLPSTSYKRNVAFAYAWYDSNKAYISGTEVQSSAAITSPSNAKYFRFTVDTAHLDTTMLIQGTTNSAFYIPFYYYFKDVDYKTVADDLNSDFFAILKTYVSQDNTFKLATSSLGAESTKFLILDKNLFDKTNILADVYIQEWDGMTGASSTWNTSDYIEVLPNSSYCSTSRGACAWYDSNKIFISGSANTGGNLFTSPANAKYFRVGVPDSSLNTFMFVKGSVLPTNYVPYQFTLASNVVINDGSHRWQDKKWYVSGDSITDLGLYEPIVKNLCKINSYVQDGQPGAKMKVMADHMTSLNLADVDLVTVFAGTNDYAGDKPLGTIADDKTVDTFYGNVKKVIDTVLTLKPTARLAFFTPLQRGAFSTYVVYPAPNALGFKLEQYVQVIKDVCALYAIPVLDLFNVSGFNSYTLPIYTGDNLHPNATGMAVISPIIASFLESI